MLYTFITEFKGGTFIDQIQAPNLRLAVLTWRKRIAANDIAAVGTLDDIDLDEEPVPITGTLNCWGYGCMNLKDQILHVNIVLTVEQRSKGKVSLN